MEIKQLSPNFIMPVRASDTAGGYDIFMPEGGVAYPNQPTTVKLGFSAAVPEGHVALLLPRSGTGSKAGLRLRNTCGVIDSDYRGEWVAVVSTDREPFHWKAGSRQIQMVIVPVATPELQLVEELSETNRGEGGFGSTGE
ncbi:dUTPase [Pseudomonas phage PAP02]|nr:dUTPase [Pseudomonas phage PAP02]QKE55124.1 deoxyuridine 5'-triphosphate nucleotidohydrolase [Pseudomonas phage PAP02]